MNRRYPGSCGIISGKIDGRDSEDLIYHYPGRVRSSFGVPKELKDHLASGRLKLDGVVLHGTYNPPMVGMAAFLRKIGLPYLFIPHDPYPPSLLYHHRWRKSIFWALFEKPMIEGAVAVQLLDASHEKFLRDLGVKVSTFVQPNGCELESLKQLEGDAHIPGSRPILRIQYLGRMDRNHKGLDLLIRAFAELDGDEPLELWLVGNDWHDREELEGLAHSLGLSDRVYFKGRRPEPSIVLHAATDVSVLPSRFDGFGLTIVEAMLAGRPVLVSAQAGVSTHVKQAGAGWVVEPTVGGLAEALREVVASRERLADLGQRGKDYVFDHLTWDQVSENTYREYRRCFLGD